MKQNLRPLTRLMIASAIICLFADPLAGGEIEIRFETPPAAAVIVAIFDSPNTFGDFRDPIRTQSCSPGEPCVIRSLPPEPLAFIAFADSNGNQMLDRNFLGIPTEAIGFANEYEPSGPPIWERASFVVTGEESRTFIVKLRRPLGERGRIGIGPGVIVRTSPYKDDDSLVTQPIPALAWQGNRIQILGPQAQIGLVGTGALRLAATARYRIGVYEEDDSPVLDGLGDRDGTLMVGLALVSELPGGFEIEVGYDHDALDEIGGGESEVTIDKSFQLGRSILIPQLIGQWSSSDLADHDFGVPAAAASPGRAAYSVGSTFNYGAGLTTIYEVTSNWTFFGSVSALQLDDDIVESPIVDDDYVLNGVFGLSYLF